MKLIKGSETQRNMGLRFVYRNNKEKVCAYIMANNGSGDEAKDIFQETVIAFYENVKAGKFKGESTISTYLYSIGKFKWLNQIKKNQVRSTHYDQLPKNVAFDSPLTKIMDLENRKSVLDVLSRLGEVCKKLLIENLYHNASMKEVVANGDFSSEQIARNKKYKCIKKLKELIGKQPKLIQVLRENG